MVRERIEAHISSLTKARVRVIVPMPAFAEVLSSVRGDMQVLLERFASSSAVEVTPFGKREAIELAEMNRTLPIAELGKGDTSRTRQVVKVDRQIIATAKVSSADVLYTMDRGMASVAEAHGLTVRHAADLPTAPATQRGLFDG